MSVTFTLHTLAILDLLKNGSRYTRGNIHELPKKLEAEAILLNYPFLRNRLTRLTREQKNYLGTR